jgi:hypothetical protein
VFKGFWERVDKSGDCWLWTGSKNKSGYGSVLAFGRTMTTHRVSWALTYGDIPDGLFVCHHCDNPPCVNPDHLFLGTHQDNMDDAMSKGRMVFPYETRSRVARFPGELNPSAKLTESDVLLIKELSATTEITRKQLAEKFGVSRDAIRDVIVGRRWKHLQ